MENDPSADLEMLKAQRNALQMLIDSAEASDDLNHSEKFLQSERLQALYDAEDILDEWQSGYPEITDKVALQIRTATSKNERLVKNRDRCRKKHQAPTSSLGHGDHPFKDAVVHHLLARKDSKDLSVVPIVGMEIQEQIILARAVYNDKENIEPHFPLRGWVDFGPESDEKLYEKTLLKRIAESVSTEPCKSEGLDTIQRSLIGFLEEKRVLLVLLDVRGFFRPQHEDVCRRVIDLLSGSCSPGSVTLFFTRDRNIAEKIRTFPFPLYLNPAKEGEECWKIFESAANSSPEIENRDFNFLREKVIEKCKGLPLAAKLLGKVFRKVDYPIDSASASSLMEDMIENQVIPALRNIYDQLSTKQKSCLLYCSLFPEGYLLDKEKVVRRWMAQEFVDFTTKKASKRKRRPEDGLNYVTELSLGYFLVQDKTNLLMYTVQRFILDFLNDIRPEYVRYPEDELRRNTRHLSLKPRGCQYELKSDFFRSKQPIQGKPAICLRSLLFLPSTKIRLEIEDDVFSSILGLRTLDLSDTSLKTLPESIGDLKHLRFLALNHTAMRSLPESICRLYNLQYLELYNCFWLEKLPENVGNLRNLRYLGTARDYGPRLDLPKQIGKLVNLQHFDGLTLRKGNNFCGLAELRDLNNFDELDVSGLSSMTNLEDAQKAGMQAKKSLKILKLTWSSDEPVTASELFGDLDYEELYNLRKDSSDEDQNPDKPGNTTRLIQEQPVCEPYPPAWNKCDYSDKLEGEVDDEEYNNFGTVQPEESTEDEEMLAEPLLEALKPHTSIEDLELQSYPGPSFPPWIMEISSFNKLKRVVLKDCACISLPPIGLLPQLDYLSVDGMPVETIGASFLGGDASCNTEAFPKLEKLLFCNMRKWKVWEGMEENDFPQLKQLRLINCPELEGLPFAGSGFPALTVLEMDRCKKLREITGLTSLKRLDLCRCDELIKIDYSVARLSGLTLVQCGKLTHLPPLKELQSLWVEECEQLQSLGSPSIQNLMAAHCGKLRYSEEKLPFMESLPSPEPQVFGFGEWEEEED